MITFLARVIRHEQVGMITLQLIRDEDAVELVGGDEFVTVAMKVNPFEEGS